MVPKVELFGSHKNAPLGVKPTAGVLRGSKEREKWAVNAWLVGESCEDERKIGDLSQWRGPKRSGGTD